MSFFFVFFAGQGSHMETTSLNLHCNKVRPCDCILSNGLWEEVLGTASNSWLVTYVWSSLLSFIYPFLLVGMWTLDHGNKNDILEMKTQWSKRLLGLLTSLQSKTTKTTSILGGEREIYSISFLSRPLLHLIFTCKLNSHLRYRKATGNISHRIIFKG